MEHSEFVARIILTLVFVWLNGFLVCWLIEVLKNKKK